MAVAVTTTVYRLQWHRKTEFSMFPRKIQLCACRITRSGVMQKPQAGYSRRLDGPLALFGPGMAPRGLAESSEQGDRIRVLHHPVLRMPLNSQGKISCRGHPHGLDGSVRRRAFHRQTGRETVDAL